MRLDDIRRHPRNPKLHAAADIRRSINHHGSVEPITLDERTGYVVAGHGRLDAYQWLHANGRPLPDGLLVDDDGMWLAPVSRGWSSRSDEDAQVYLIGSNHMTVKGGWDDRQLAEMLGDLQQADMLELTGFDNDSLDTLVRQLDGFVGPRPEDGDTSRRGAGVPPAEFPSYDDDIHTDYQCPKCSYEWSGKPR